MAYGVCGCISTLESVVAPRECHDSRARGTVVSQMCIYMYIHDLAIYIIIILSNAHHFHIIIIQVWEIQIS